MLTGSNSPANHLFELFGCAEMSNSNVDSITTSDSVSTLASCPSNLDSSPVSSLEIQAFLAGLQASGQFLHRSKHYVKAFSLQLRDSRPKTSGIWKHNNENRVDRRFDGEEALEVRAPLREKIYCDVVFRDDCTRNSAPEVDTFD